MPLPPLSPAAAGGDDDAQGRVGARLLRRRHQQPRLAAVELPEPLKDSDSDDEAGRDAAEARAAPLPVNMNHSIFGLIAAAGSRVDFNGRFDDGSSDDDEADDSALSRRPRHDLSLTAILRPSPRPEGACRGHRKRLSGHKLLKSISSLPRRTIKASRESSRRSPPSGSGEQSDPSDSSQPPAINIESEHRRLAPVMSRMLQARAEMSSRPSFDLERRSADLNRAADAGDGDGDGDDETAPLAKMLKDIFGFDEPEPVVQEYPCWLLQSVLLQGFLYVTAKHICFYAYLPKKDNVVAKSGYLSKSGKRNPKYNRYWFRLKGDVLSYYCDPTNLYFPHGQIDLRFGISASVVDRDKEGVHFTVVTSHRTYNFRADSAASAKEWVKSLQRVIFQSHNDGDSVKISLPIANIIDVEETQMVEFSDTCKIRVIDNDETYAIDEYFFSFFSLGQEAIDLLKLLVEDASGNQERAADASAQPSPAGSKDVDKSRTGRFPESVKATLSPKTPHSAIASPRASCETSSRTSLDQPRQLEQRSHEASSAVGEQSPAGGNASGARHVLESSESNLQLSTDEPSYSNLAVSVTDEPSASQILRGSDVFQSPTMRRSPSTQSAEAGKAGESKDEDKESHPRARSAQPPRHAATTGHLDLQQAQVQGDGERQRPLTPTLHSISKMGSNSLLRAGALAGYLNKTSKRMSSLLATESMGYVEKVSGMWRGGRKHYDEPAGMRPDEDELVEDSEGKIQTSMERFRAHFALPETERLQAMYFGYLNRVLPLYGKMYLSDRSFCFRSLLPGTRTKLILPLRDIETVHKEKGFRFGYAALVVVIRGHEELFFEFGHAEARDDCAVTLLQELETARHRRELGLLGDEERQKEDSALAERDALRSARLGGGFGEHELELPREAASVPNAPVILPDEADGLFLNFKPHKPMHITCLTIGSRGDVQPYIALCKGLLAEGHRPRIATHAEFRGWIEGHGIEFACVEGDPGELMRLCIENGTFTLAFLRKANATFRGWLDELLESAWRACQGSELLIESPSAMAGIHIAERLCIPYFRAFTMPWTRTRAYPHAFIMPEHKMGGAYNYVTYIMFDNVFWRATAHQVNRWRNKTLGLPNTTLEKMQPNKVPFLYNFSPSVVVPPLDFSDWIRVTGYWFLEEGAAYGPPPELADFIARARADGKKLVYVGFGSIIVNDPARMTQEVIDAVLRADVRCILSKGWSDRLSAKEGPGPDEEPPMPADILTIKAAPHDWLFAQVDAAAHHGGSGTTGASLRAGIPTIIRPFFGDQYFFASRVEDLGVGVWVRRWGTNSFGRALWEATRNERMIAKARVLGEQIRRETGVDNAIQSIYRDLEYAKSLVMRKAGKNAQLDEADGEADGGGDDEDNEESWTFVGYDDPDADARRLGEARALGSQVIKGA